jgi:hypothetical protein
MGGSQLNGMSQQITGPQGPMMQPDMTGGGGKGGQTGGNTKGPYGPGEGTPGVAVTPMPNMTGMVSQKDSALTQGLGGMDLSMDWMQNAMNYQAPQLGGDYNVGGLDGDKYLGNMGAASGGGYNASMMSAPGKELYDYDPALAQAQSYSAAQLSDKNINDYMNPYTQNVIDTTMGDLNKARQQALNSTGAAATSGGAFGGDRHGIMEAQNNADYMDQVARSSAQLRNQGYQNAQQAAMGDVNALNQSYQSNAGMAQQSNLANQSANNARSQFVGSTANSNAMQTAANNQSASNQAKALGAQLSSQASIANANNRNSMLSQLMGYDNANQQFNASMDFSKDQFNAGQDQQQFTNQMNAANQMYGMGNDRWNMGQDAINNLGQVGGQIDAINNQYLGQGFNMFNGMANSPFEQYQYALGPLGSLTSGGSTTTNTPGTKSMLGNAMGIGGAFLKSDARLKENIKKVATINGINLYEWDWNETGKQVAGEQATFGVIAQEVLNDRPDAILEDSNGWLVVDYGKLPEVSRTVMMRNQ